MGTVVSVSYGASTTSDEVASLTEKIFDIFHNFDCEFSTYRDDSLISRINSSSSESVNISKRATQVFEIAEQYRVLTDGHFSIIDPNGKTDPSGIVKAYAIQEAGLYLDTLGISKWCINAGGDILTSGVGNGLHAGIVSPSDRSELISDIVLRDPFVSLATSGHAERGNHIWSPKGYQSDVLQASVVSDDIIFSDVMATAIIACGSSALRWIESRENAEALLVKKDGSFLITEGYLDLVP